MIIGTAQALAGPIVRAVVPVVPDEQIAREWVETELRDPAYAAAQPGPLDRAISFVLERIGSVEGGPSLWFWLVLLVVVAVVGVLVVRRNGVARARARTGSAAGAVGVDPAVTSEEYRRRAVSAAAAGDWHTAVLEQFRALVRSLEERTVLEPRPGRTADEAAREAGELLPDRASELDAVARVFDDVCYGDREARPEHHHQVAAVDTAVLSTRLTIGVR